MSLASSSLGWAGTPQLATLANGPESALGPLPELGTIEPARLTTLECMDKALEHGRSGSADSGGVMSRADLVHAYKSGQIGRREFLEKLTMIGGALGAALVATQVGRAAAADPPPPTNRPCARRKSVAKSSAQLPPFCPE